MGSFGESYVASLMGARQQMEAEKNSAVDRQVKTEAITASQEARATSKATAEQEALLQQNFQSIVQKDGMSAALEYYQTVKPKEGSEILKTIADTKKSIAETLKTNAEKTGIDLTNESSVRKMTADALDTIGGFGSQIMQLPEEQQQAVFQEMLPKLQNLDQNFPDNFEQAKTYFQGAAALSVPQNKIWEADQQMRRAQTDTVKTIDYLNQNGDKLGETQRKALEADQNKALESQVQAKESNILERLKMADAGEKGKEGGENLLRTELMTETKDFRATLTSSYSIKQSLKSDSPFGDHTAIFMYMKTIDPTSTIREGEMDTVRAAKGVPDAVKNAYEQAYNGNMLTPAQRKDMLKAVDSIISGKSVMFNSIKDKYTKIAMDRNYNLEHVIFDYGEKKQAAEAEKTIGSLPDEIKGPAVEVYKQLDQEDQKDMLGLIKKGYPVDQLLKHWQAKQGAK